MQIQKIKNTVFYRLISFGRLSLCYMVFSSFVGSILEGMTLSFFIPILFGSSEQLLKTSGVAGNIFRFFWDLGLFSTTYNTLATLAAAVSLRGGVEFLRLYYQSQVSFDIGEKIRMRALKSLGETDYLQFLRFTRGDLVNFFNTEIAGSINGLSKLAQIIALLFSSLALIIVSVNLNPLFTIVGVFVAVLLGLFFKNTNKWLINFSRSNSQKSAEFHGLLLQGLTYFKYLMSTERFKTFEKKILEALERLLLNKRHYSFRSAFISSIQEPIAVFCLIGVILFETHFYQTPMSSLMVSLLVFYRVMKNLNALQLGWQGYLVTTGSTEIVLSILDQFDEYRVNLNSDKSHVSFQKEISLVGLGLTISGNTIISNLNLSIPKFQTVAIVGESGAGKSTIVDLITGMISPSLGEVRVDGMRLSDLNIVSWRKSIGLVTQEPVCFPGTVLENVTFWDTSADPERVKLVIGQAGATEFVASRQGGLSSALGDSGVNFSGGQRQRIAISRELYREPSLLILDEATSALDAENEDIIQSSLLSMKGKLTIVMVTHRMASVRNADKIYVMEKGTIIQEGTFKDLYSQTSGKFHQLCQRQGV